MLEGLIQLGMYEKVSIWGGGGGGGILELKWFSTGGILKRKDATDPALVLKE